MEDGRVWFDISAYMLFEATGDSEAPRYDAAFDLDSDSPPSEDDAQSCSYGSVCDGRRSREDVDAGGDEFRGADFGDWSGEEEEEEDGVVDQCCRRRAEKPANSKGCEEEMMNEREGDRQFWEACLAS